ncbi:MAG: formyltransferase family protein, partial [Ignavibacteriaceae bacterium]|nr:formyltransferase family protein [Ignavibacteriaceae bacterium]
ELLKNDYQNKFILQGIIIQSPLGKKSIKKLIPQMLNFYGFLNFLLLGVKFTIYKLLNFLAVNIFNGKFPGTFSVEHILRKNSLKIISIKDINSKESLEFLRTMNIDIIFSIAASQIFRIGVLDIPKIGCFNIHTSKLPQNRGMMPNFWSLYNYDKDPVSAITIHRMNESLDDGDILLQEEFHLDPKESLDSLIKRTKIMSTKLFLKAVDLISNNKQNLIKNDSAKATYNSFPTKEDVKRFKEKGLKIR